MVKDGVVRLIVIAGPAGSGKSTLANAFAEILGVPHVDFDTVSDELVELRRNENPQLSEPELLEAYKAERYLELARCVREFCGDLLIASGPFSAQAQSPKLWDDWLSECGKVTAVEFLWLQVDPKIRKIRLIRRNSARDELVLNSDQSLQAVPLPLIKHRIVDASETVDEQCRTATSLFL